jgi:hypothetical protein
MPEPMPVPPCPHRLPADVTARIRATAARAIGPRRTAALVLAFGRLARVENRYLGLSSPSGPSRVHPP